MKIDKAIQLMGNTTNEIYTDPVSVYPTNLVASVDNMLVSYEGDTLSLSRNGGESFDESLVIPELQIVKFIHLFSDGKLLVANHDKCFYSHDWDTYAESVIYNIEGEIYTPVSTAFDSYKNGTVKKIVDGVELAVWGGYSYTAQTWYTADYGVTVKCCYQFNLPDTLVTAHIHAVDFNPYDNTFWLQSGDYDYESHWVKGTYDLATDTWQWIPFASGLNFKSTNMIFHTNGYVYWSWDKHPGGAVRAPYATLGDVSTHELLVETNKDCHFMIIGPRGDVVVFQTIYNGTEQPRIMYYAPDGFNFVKITGRMPVEHDASFDSQYQTYWGINSKGKILAGVVDLSVETMHTWDRKPSVFVDDFIREAGYPFAFR